MLLKGKLLKVQTNRHGGQILYSLTMSGILKPEDEVQLIKAFQDAKIDATVEMSQEVFGAEVVFSLGE